MKVLMDRSEAPWADYQDKSSLSDDRRSPSLLASAVRRLGNARSSESTFEVPMAGHLGNARSSESIFDVPVVGRLEHARSSGSIVDAQSLGVDSRRQWADPVLLSVV